MKVILYGSRGHVTLPLTKILVSKGIDVTVITRSEENAKLIEKDGAKAAIGSIDNVEFLAKTFKGADCVFILLAASLFDSNLLGTINLQCNKACDAILKNNIQNVVYLSSIGADHPEIGIHYQNEIILKNKLNNLKSVSFVRPTGFFTNFFNYIKTIKTNGCIYLNSSRDQIESFVHPADIGKLCSDLILNPSTNKNVIIKGIESDRVDAGTIEKFLSEILKKDIKWVSISDEDALKTYKSFGIPENNAELLINLYSKKYHDTIMKEMYENTDFIKGNHKLIDFFKTEFLPIYNSS